VPHGIDRGLDPSELHDPTPADSVVVTPALGLVPAIYVPREPAQPSVWPAVRRWFGRLAHHPAGA
jgi:hypothetical protein